PARCIAASTTWPPSVAPCVRLNAPRQDFASAVRAVETMTASTTALLLARTRALHEWLVLETFSAGRERREHPRRLPERRIGVRVRGEFVHTPQDLPEAHATRVEHRPAALDREPVAR